MQLGQKKILRLIKSDQAALVHSAACNPRATSAPSSRGSGAVFAAAIGVVCAALVSSSAAVAQTAPPSESVQLSRPLRGRPRQRALRTSGSPPTSCSSACSLSPTISTLRFRYAELETDLGDYEAAIGALERMLYYNPNLPRVKLQLGVLYFHLHSYEMARSYFNAVLASKDLPDDVRPEVKAISPRSIARSRSTNSRSTRRRASHIRPTPTPAPTVPTSSRSARTRCFRPSFRRRRTGTLSGS